MQSSSTSSSCLHYATASLHDTVRERLSGCNLCCRVELRWLLQGAAGSMRPSCGVGLDATKASSGCVLIRVTVGCFAFSLLLHAILLSRLKFWRQLQVADPGRWITQLHTGRLVFRGKLGSAPMGGCM